MEKRYQVFISSTFRDLVEERQHVLQAVMRLKAFPAGMELFTASNEAQWQYIRHVIDECDYYVLIIGARYGSITTEGVSYTEREYDYAIGQKIPVLAFIHEKPEDVAGKHTELDPDARAKLDVFRAKVAEGRLVKYWTRSEELKFEVTTSLLDAFTAYPAVGWVRASTLPSTELLTEMNELRKLNAELEGQLQEARSAVGTTTFEAGLRLATDSRNGKYPENTAHRREIIREIKHAAEILAGLTPPVRTWEEVRERHIVALWQARLAQLRAEGSYGRAGAQVTVSRFLSLSKWLRDQGHLPEIAARMPSNWKQRLRDDVMRRTGGREERPRVSFTPAESDAIIAAAQAGGDPRFALLVALAGGPWLGVAVRASRRDIDSETRTISIPGKGPRPDYVLSLSDTQWAQLQATLTSGYLAPWEDNTADFPLFPGGKLRRGRVHDGMRGNAPMQKRTVHRLFKIAEAKAGVRHSLTRAWSGLRPTSDHSPQAKRGSLPTQQEE